MIYNIVHRTSYRYNAPVSRCRNETHLRPRDTDHQQCLENRVVVDPTPTSWSERFDYFGNSVVSFAVDGPFDQLTVTSISSVSVAEQSPIIHASPDWQDARDALFDDLSAEMLEAREFC